MFKLFLKKLLKALKTKETNTPEKYFLDWIDVTIERMSYVKVEEIFEGEPVCTHDLTTMLTDASTEGLEIGFCSEAVHEIIMTLSKSLVEICASEKVLGYTVISDPVDMTLTVYAKLEDTYIMFDFT